MILTVMTEEVPRVSDAQRVTVEKLSAAFSRVILRFGFMKSPNVPGALRELVWNSDEVSFFLSRRVLVASAESGLPLWQDHVYIALARAASDASDHFSIPEDRAVEVGARITI